MNIICLDTETTGLNLDNDEILQLSIIDGDGEILFNEYIKPSHRKQWTKAERIHGIKPSDVKNCKTLLDYKDQIQEILLSADVIVGYNIVGFDLPMLFNNGIRNDVKDGSVTVDVMLSFAAIYGDYNERTYSYKWKKLRECASYYSYKADHWHDALDDAKATLFCFYKIFGNPPSIPSVGEGIYPSVGDDEEANVYDRIAKRYESLRTSTVSSSPDPAPVKKKKTGRVMIFFGVLCVIGFCGSFLPGFIVCAALLFFFGIRRHKAFKSSLNENGKPE